MRKKYRRDKGNTEIKREGKEEKINNYVPTKKFKKGGVTTLVKKGA